ncbi:Zinc finger C2HC domain-containing protein 1B [Phytophthora citrophthora]|uniref:Zinc finger C2HC domain-containing protein 1B n=1 Tax=Phytophthora citrophthora TaxID=4793 RepID=A0AAD9LCS5_9STRA|nr:Zinc finger C2HC domain-containing protein 1B [Phytophthora citrophthora]
MGNSLMLLKSKMSRRKARSAPTNQASLFVEKNTPSAVVHSARLLSPTPMIRDIPTPPPRQSVVPRRAPAQTAVQAAPGRRKAPLQNLDEEANGEIRYPAPISTGFNLPDELDEYGDGAEQMEQCHNCSRKFNIASFTKHQKICEKVFSGQRKVFNMAAKRLEGTEAEKLASEAKAKAKTSGGGRKAPLSATEQPIKVKNTADWKQKSEMFRNAMKASRDVTMALKEGKELPPVMPSAPDPSLIQCEYCSRRFNEKAAERHINFCREKSQRDSIKANSKRASAPKPGSRAAATRKR